MAAVQATITDNMRSILTGAGLEQHLVDYAVQLRLQASGGNTAAVDEANAETQRSQFDSAKYLARVADLDRPIDLTRDPLAASLLRPRPRPPSPPPPKTVPSKASRPLRQPLSPDAKRQLADAYWSNAETSVPQRFGAAELSAAPLTTVVPGRAWVVRDLLSATETVELRRRGEAEGLKPPSSSAGVAGLRNNRRTDNLIDPAISMLVAPKLPEELLLEVEGTAPHTTVRGIHPNWRIACYGADSLFAAHYDQADSLVVKREADGGPPKERYTSSHTLLIALSDGEDFEGGATRLFPLGRYDETAVDVALPRGYALVFDQTLLHAGQRVRAGSKFIAQAGVLRGEPDTPQRAPSVFRFGPGLPLA